MRINRKVILPVSANRTTFQFSRSVNMGEIEAFTLAVISVANKQNDTRTIAEILEGEFGFNKKLVSFYTTNVLDYLVNTGAIVIEDDSVNADELIPFDIVVNNQVDESIEKETFLTTEVKRKNIIEFFTQHPITGEVIKGDIFTNEKPTFEITPKKLTKLKLKGVKERFIEEQCGLIFIQETESKNYKKKISMEIELEINFETNSIVLDDRIKDFVSDNTLTGDFFELFNYDNEVSKGLKFFRDFEKFRLIDKKSHNGISLDNGIIYKIGSKEFKPTNFKGASIILPAYKDWTLEEYIALMKGKDLYEFAKAMKIEKTVANIILGDRKLSSEDYNFMKSFITLKNHEELLSKHNEFITSENVDIFISSNPEWGVLKKILLDKKVNAKKQNLSSYSELIWGGIKEIASNNNMTKEFRSWVKADQELNGLDIDCSKLEQAKESFKLFKASENLLINAFSLEESKRMKNNKELFNSFVMLEKQEMKKRCKDIGQEVREIFEKKLKKFKTDNIGWVSKNINKFDTPSQKELNKAWKFANKFSHLVEVVFKDDLTQGEQALKAAKAAKLKKEVKDVS